MTNYEFKDLEGGVYCLIKVQLPHFLAGREENYDKSVRVVNVSA
jgi:hypothetical protein